LKATNRKIYLNLHNKMALPDANSTSRTLFTLFHAGLLLNWLFVFSRLLPVVALLPLIIILLYEKTKKTPFSESALLFAWKRFVFHAIIIIGTALYGLLTGFTQEMLIQAYILQSYALIPLAGYDAYRTYQGGLGLEPLRPIKEKIRKIRG